MSLFCIIDDRIYLGNIQGTWLTIDVSKEEAIRDIVTKRLIPQWREGGNMRQRVKRIKIAKKKINRRKGTERQKLAEKQGRQLARTRTESKDYSAETKRAEG